MSTSQTLTLTVASPQAMPPGCRRSVAFAQRGGSIGRSEDCDWVLSSSGISRTHAQVRYLNGIYFIEDRSTNGMLLNGAPMSRGEPATLSEGDRLQLDAFMIEVALRADADGKAPSAAAEHAFPDYLLPPAPSQPWEMATGREPAPDPVRVPVASNSLPAGDPFADDGLLAGLGESGERELDPLRLLDETPDPAPDVMAGGWNHTPASADHFQPPRTAAPPAQLPERWDLTTGEWAGPTAAAQAAQTATSASSAPPMFSPPSIPDFDELLDFGPASPEADAGTGHDLQTETASSPAAETPVVPAFAAAPAPTRTPSPAPEATAPVPTPTSTPAETPAQVPSPAAMHDGELDRVLGIVVDGVMEVLRARAEIKNTFRLPVTIIQRTENNPLKFAATPDEAIRKLMAPDNGAFLAGAAAFEDAFEDIRCHQVAMLAGMRAAFESLLFHFNPDRHEQEVDSSGKRAFAGKARYWERYRDNFETLVKDPDECFRRLFGDEFARAYEAQLARLKSSRRTRAR